MSRSLRLVFCDALMRIASAASALQRRLPMIMPMAWSMVEALHGASHVLRGASGVAERTGVGHGDRGIAGKLFGESTYDRFVEGS